MGKSTVLKELELKAQLRDRFDEIHFFYEKKPPKSVALGGTVEGEKWFLNFFQERNRHYREILGRNEGACILADMTRFNIPVYAQAFVELGRMLGSDSNRFEREVMGPFKATGWVCYDLLVVLDAQTSEVLDRIARRDRGEKIAWREEDIQYVELVRRGYARLVNSPPDSVRRVLSIRNRSVSETVSKVLQAVIVLDALA